MAASKTDEQPIEAQPQKTEPASPPQVSQWDAELKKPGRFIVGNSVVDGNGNVICTKE